MSISSAIDKLKSSTLPHVYTLIAVSKTHPADAVQEAYEAGQRDFGENKVQEMLSKQEVLPADIRWHLIGHLQTNKVKYIVPFVHLIHSVDSLKLLTEINKQGERINRTISCLLQIYIAQEETKFGLSPEEAKALLLSPELASMKFVNIIGLMGMASNTDDISKIKSEFRSLNSFFKECQSLSLPVNVSLKELSMGMSSDYRLALEEGSTMIRVGSAIFGARDYK